MSRDWAALDAELNAYRQAQLHADWTYRWRYVLGPLTVLLMFVLPMLAAVLAGTILLGLLPLLLNPVVIVVGLLVIAAGLGLGYTYK